MRPHRLFFTFALAAGVALTAYSPGHAQSAAPLPSAVPAETPPAIPSPKPTAEEPKIHKLAVQQFLAWQTATVDRDRYSETVNGELSDEMLDRATKTLANLGALQSATFMGVSKAKAVDLFVYKMACQNGTVNMDFSIDPSGKIGLIFFE